MCYYPEISIITICYNSENTIEETVKSVISQDYPKLEYIIIDGKSTDRTLEIIEKYKDNISIIISEDDNGVSDAFNKGINRASGEIIGIINSDDLLLPGALNILANEYQEDIEVYRGNIIIKNNDTGKRYIEKPTMRIPYFGWNINLCHAGTFVARRAYQKYGLFNINYKYVMDYDLLLRFQRAGAKAKHIDNLLAMFVTGGITYEKYTKERRKEVQMMLRTNGASKWHICGYLFTRYTKIIIKKIMPYDIVLAMRHKKVK